MSDESISTQLARTTQRYFDEARERARTGQSDLGSGTLRAIRSRAAYAAGERRHWYYVSEDYCPLCGRTDVARERVYGERPERWEDRHERDERYDYCDVL